MGSPEPIILTARDGVRLAAVHQNADQTRAAALLLHMMPATKESWSAFAFRLAERGIASLAVDLRGHGASAGGPEGYKAFGPAEHQACRLDAEAGLDWLRAKYPGSPLFAVGASVGANLAIVVAAEQADVAAVIALSPGLDYHGVTTPDGVGRLLDGQALLMVVSREDSYASDSVNQLEKHPTEADVEVIRLEGAGHGTATLADDDLIARLVAWLEGIV